MPLDPETALDPVARRTGDPSRNRDVCRTPMPWSDEPGGGFTSADATPWLPFGDLAAFNVAAQRADRGSVLQLVRDLIALRKRHGELREGAYDASRRPTAHGRGGAGTRFAVALNLGGRRGDGRGVTGRVAIATDRARDGEEVAGAVRLGPYEGAVVELSGG